MDGFTNLKVDFAELRRDARAKQDIAQKNERDRTKTIADWYEKHLTDLLALATIPEECEYRTSLAPYGTLTIVVTGLDSFHDVTEITSILSRLGSDGDIFPQTITHAEIKDDTQASTREYSYWNRYGPHFSNIRLIATLGEEAEGCKVMKRIVHRTEYKSVSYDQAVEEIAFVCPGEPGYDDV